MTGFAAIVARELQEWKRIFIATLAAGFLVYLTPLFRVPEGTRFVEGVNAMSGFLAGGFGLGVALLAGAGLIGRDLNERRMTFFFFRPLTASSIWGGKLFAALLLAIGSVFLTLLPATFAGQGLLTLRHETAQRGLRFLMIAVVALVILGNSINLMFRARSRWVLLDLASLVAVAGLLALAALPLLKGMALRLVGILMVTLAAIFLIALLVAGLVGLSRGRTDLREVHKFHAFTVWPIMGIVALATTGYSVWVRSVGPEDLRNIYVSAAAPQGAWIALRGTSPGRVDYVPTILRNVESGQTMRAGGGSVQDIEFSNDGRVAVWLETVNRNPSESRYMVARLGPKPSVQATTIFDNPSLNISRLSPDGKRLAAIQNHILTVWDLEDERALGSVRLPTPEDKLYQRQTRLLFSDPDRIRMFAKVSETSLEVYEFDLNAKQLQHTGTATTSEDFAFFHTAAEKLVLFAFHVKELSIHDARTGELVGKIPTPPTGQSWRASLSDGRLVIANATSSNSQIRVFSPTGVFEKSIELGPADNVRLGGEPAPGKLLVALWSKIKRSGASLRLVDLNTGEVKPLEEKLLPEFYLFWNAWEAQPFPGSVATRLFHRPDGSALYDYDPVSGRRRLIAGRES